MNYVSVAQEGLIMFIFTYLIKSIKTFHEEVNIKQVSKITSTHLKKIKAHLNIEFNRERAPKILSSAVDV